MCELGLFEDVVFRTSKEIYLVLNYITVMLDNNLIGSRSKHLQNKIISASNNSINLDSRLFLLCFQHFRCYDSFGRKGDADE